MFPYKLFYESKSYPSCKLKSFDKNDRPLFLYKNFVYVYNFFLTEDIKYNADNTVTNITIISFCIKIFSNDCDLCIFLV